MSRPSSTTTSCVSEGSASCSRAVARSPTSLRDLGVHRETLRLWVRQAEADQGLRADRLTTQERDDNSMAESFVGTLKAELVRGRPFTTRFEAELAVAAYLGWFNHTRLHSSLGDLSPDQFEIDHHPMQNKITTAPPTDRASTRPGTAH